MKKIFILLSVFTIGLSAYSQDNDTVFIKKMATDVWRNGTCYENLRFLCKKIGARLSGSSNAQKAVEATARMLKEAGADTVYLQACMVPHWVRGDKEQGAIYWGKNKKDLHVCALGMSVGTAANGMKATVIEVADFDALKKLDPAYVKGKIVFFNYHMKPELMRGGYGDAVRYRVKGPVEAAKLGAVAVMIRSVTCALDNNPHTGVTVYDSAVHKIPAIACSTMDADWLHELLLKEKKAELFIKMNCQQLPDAPSYNVVGELKGTEFPNEIITVGGHLDSWDLAEGAHDDGAGCVESIEVMRALKATGFHPKRTIRVVMFMNEENGSRGGDKYAELARLNKEKHIFALESDEGGFAAQVIGIDGNEEQEAKLKNWLPLLKPYGIYDIPHGGGGADIEPLKEMGAVMSSANPNSLRYFDHHHSAIDVFETVNKRELEQAAINMAAIVYLVDKYGL